MSDRPKSIDVDNEPEVIAVTRLVDQLKISTEEQHIIYREKAAALGAAETALAAVRIAVFNKKKANKDV